MTDPKPTLDLVDVVTENFEATVVFYKALGAKVEVSGGGEHEIWHGDVKVPRTARRCTSTTSPSRRRTTRRGEERAAAAAW